MGKKNIADEHLKFKNEFDDKIKKLKSDCETELNKINKIHNLSNSDKEKVNFINGKTDTYSAMSNVLKQGMSTSKIIDTVNSTRRTIGNNICAILCNNIIGCARKSSSKKEELENLAGKYRAIQEIICILEDAFR